VDDTPPKRDDLIANIRKGKENKAKVISKIDRDETNNKIIHIATLAPYQNKDGVTRKNYSIYNINLGPTSMM
jgi:hypothetical protein